MRSVYLNFSRIFDIKALDNTSKNLLNSLNSLWTLSNVQLIQLLQLNNHNSFKYNEISLVIQFVSISGNIDILDNKWILYLVFIFNVVLLFFMIFCSVKDGTRILKHIQVIILIYCSVLEYPIISLMIQFIIKYQDFRENLIIYVAATNLFFYFQIQIFQQIFGKSFCLDIHDFYAPMLQVGFNSFIRFFKIFMISIAYISDNKFTIFMLLTIYQVLKFYQQYKFVQATSFKMVQSCLIQIVCVIIYLNISIVWSLILIMLVNGISTQYHQYLYHNLISNQSESNLNIAYICTELSKHNRNMIEQYVILQHHNCLKCKDYSDIQVCILKKLKFNKEQDKRINLLFSNKISKKYPIRALITLIKGQYGLRIDYQFKYTCQIMELRNQINKIQLQFQLKDEKNTLTVSNINQSIKLYEDMIKQYINIIKEQIFFWKRALQGFQTNYQCLVYFKKVSHLMIENKRSLIYLIKQQNLNVIELKILQLHYAVVYLDYKKIHSYQRQIDDKLMMDRYKLDKNVNNKVLYEGRYLLVQTSLIFNKGQLINFQQQNYNQFFNLPYDQRNQINRIEDLMPSFKRPIHNNFLDNYIRKGYSSIDKSGLDIFICNPEGYIIMSNLQVNYDNSIMNDVILTGLISKEQNINKAMLITLDGKILGMDKGSFHTIKSHVKTNLDISELAIKVYFIQSFIKNIQQSIDLLNQNYQINNQRELLYVNDLWVTESHNNQYIQINNQIIEQKEKISKAQIKKVNQIYSEINIGNNIVYNLFFINHHYKGGELCYIKLMIIDQEDNCFNNLLSNQMQSFDGKRSWSNSNYTSDLGDQGIKENRASLQISQLNQNYKFFTQLLSQSQQHDNVQENHKESNFIITARLEDNELIQQVQEESIGKKTKVIKERNVESSMASQSSSEDSQYLEIINNLYDQQKMVRPLVSISFVLSLTIIYTLIIIFVNQAQIQNSVNNQLAQITVLRKPQNISYVYTSLSNQLLFKYANQKGFVQLSPFMIYWNQVQQVYMQKYIESLIVPLNIEVPIIANSFNMNTVVQQIFINDQLYEIEVSFQQFYDQIVQYFFLLKDDDQFDKNINSLLSKGFLRQNLIKLFDLNYKILKQVNSNVTSLQQSEISIFLLSILIELLILLVFYSIQIAWWQKIDKIITELILIVHRFKVSQIESRVENLQMIQDILILDKRKWIQSPIDNFTLDTQEQDSSQRKQQLITLMPQDYYINKKNLLICISILIINILFNITGYLIYQKLNVNFQSNLSSMSNYVQFLHDADCSFMFGGFIKLDGPLNTDQSYLIDQKEIIEALYVTSNRLLPQLNNLQQIIYSSQLQENNLFYQLLYENLCETSDQLLVMCDTSKIQLEYWEKDLYINLVQNGIIGFTNQFIKYVTENYLYEFSTLQYTQIESSEKIIDQPIFQNLFLQYFLDVQETLRVFLKTFYQQNIKMGQDIVQQIQGYYIGFGIFFLLLSGITYYFWIKHNQYQIYLALQIIGIIPNTHIINQNFKQQVLNLYKTIY